MTDVIGRLALPENHETGALMPRGALILAPMAGYTTSVFRRLVHDLGADYTFTEMISAESRQASCAWTAR